MKKYLFAALFCLSLCCAYCQISEVERCDDLDLLTVAEKKLLPVLDAVLAEERTRNYYRSDTKFSIFFQADSTIQIEAFDLLFSLSETASEDYYGVIEYGGHSFFVAGAYLDERIFLPVRGETAVPVLYGFGIRREREDGTSSLSG